MDFEEESYIDPVPQEEEEDGIQLAQGLIEEDEDDEFAGVIFEADEGYEEPNIVEIFPEFEPDPDIQGSLEATWIVLDEEPGMDQLIKVVDEESLNKMQEETQAYPFQTFKGQEDRLFEGRFEFPVGRGGKRYPEGFARSGYTGS